MRGSRHQRIAVGTLALAVAFAGGYVLGKQRVFGQRAAANAAAIDESVRLAESSSPGTSGKKSLDPVRVKLRIRELIRSSPSMDWDRETLAEIDSIFAGLPAEVFAALHAEQVAMLERYKTLAKTDRNASLENLFPHPTMRSFYSHWVEKDGRAATDGVFSLGIYWLRPSSIHYEWALADPDAALEWALSPTVAERFPNDLEEVQSRSFYFAANKDFDATLDKLSDQDAKLRAHLLPGLASGIGHDEARVSRLIAMADTLPERDDVIGRILGSYAAERPAEALALAAGLEGSQQTREERKRRCLASAPAEFFPQWLETRQMPGSAELTEEIGMAIEEFISNHPPEAIEWLNRLPASLQQKPVRAQVVKDLVESLHESSDPFGGTRGSAADISDSALRREVYLGLYRKELERNPEEAEVWRSAVPEEDRPSQ